MSFAKTAAAAILLAGSACGHMIMNTPTPYGAHTVQSSPLNGDNYLFPCQSGSRADAFNPAGASNSVQAGGSQLVKFTGSAVHGGGSCQFSVTYDYPPPADPSKWKVIHTMIGGCPASAAGNINGNGQDQDGRPDGVQCGDSTGTECVRQFNVPIPTGLKSGNATFAWTWFNKIGNREMYMNCAPLTITGGASDDSFFNSLPEIFVANIPGHCSTDNGVLDIPNPGASVERLEAPTPGALGKCPAGSSSGGSTPVASSSKAQASTPAATPSVPGVFAPGAGETTTAAVATSFATVVVPTSADAPVETPVETPVQTPVVSTPVVAPSAPANTNVAAVPTGSSGCGVNRIACPTDGALVCMGTDYFGLCDRGCAYKMAVAAGTKCENNAIGHRFKPRAHFHKRRIHGHS